MNEEKYLIHGADASEEDTRTIKRKLSTLDKVTAMFSFLTEGGSKIKPECILDQNRVGICTAIANTMIVHDRTGVQYSEDFQYGLQKHFIDGSWYEGSSAFSSLRASKKYGYLRKNIFDVHFKRDPNESYEVYSYRLRQIFENTQLLNQLLSQCEFPLQGYEQLENNWTSILTAIADKKNGVIARFTCGSSWFYKFVNGVRLTCWEGETIEPITEPVESPTFPITGHLVSLPFFKKTGLFVGNSWSRLWCGDGHANIDYYPTEVWKMYFTNFESDLPLPVKKDEFKHSFIRPMGLSQKYVYEVEMLQYALIFEGCMDWVAPEHRGYFGGKTFAGVRKFQKKYGILTTGYVGKLTLAKLNSIYNK